MNEATRETLKAALGKKAADMQDYEYAIKRDEHFLNTSKENRDRLAAEIEAIRLDLIG